MSFINVYAATGILCVEMTTTAMVATKTAAILKTHTKHIHYENGIPHKMIYATLHRDIFSF